MKFSFRRKLNQVGMLSLHALIPIVLAVVAVGGVGAYVITSSKAASVLDSSGCVVRGRNWTGTSCAQSCISGAGSYIASSPNSYCSGALSKIARFSCDSYGRKWLDVGCARRWDQKTTANAIQCAAPGAKYIVLTPDDKCFTSEPSFSCRITGPTSLNKGSNATWNIYIKNSGATVIAKDYWSSASGFAPMLDNSVTTKYDPVYRTWDHPAMEMDNGSYKVGSTTFGESIAKNAIWSTGEEVLAKTTKMYNITTNGYGYIRSYSNIYPDDWDGNTFYGDYKLGFTQCSLRINVK